MSKKSQKPEMIIWIVIRLFLAYHNLTQEVHPTKGRGVEESRGELGEVGKKFQFQNLKSLTFSQ
jgi:hypothetical protein